MNRRLFPDGTRTTRPAFRALLRDRRRSAWSGHHYLDQISLSMIPPDPPLASQQLPHANASTPASLATKVTPVQPDLLLGRRKVVLRLRVGALTTQLVNIMLSTNWYSDQSIDH